MHQEISGFRAAIVEKDKHITSLTEILQGRNPEMLEILTEIKKSNHQIIEFMQIMHAQNRKELIKQTRMLEEGKVRSNKIDAASKKHVGSIMRVPAKRAPVKKK